MDDLFDLNPELEAERQAVYALARICQISLAAINARRFAASDYVQKWHERVNRQIAINRRHTRASLYWQIEHPPKLTDIKRA